MAKNGAPGKGREGIIKNRSQTFNPKTKLWTKRNDENGLFIDTKTTGGKFKDVKKEK